MAKRKLTIKKIKKRDGRIFPFSQRKITNAIWKAAESVGGRDKERAQYLSDKVVDILEKRFNGHAIATVEQIQDVVEAVLMRRGHYTTAKAYILYRDLHNKIRDVKSLIDSDELMGNYINGSDWRIKENSNMAYSLQGLNNHVASTISKHYWLNQFYPKGVRDAHQKGDLHIHDLQLLAPYCVGWDLQDLLIRGFTGVSGKAAAKPAKHLRTALGQLANFFYTLQGESAGANAVSNFDTLLAPFVWSDKLSYKWVKQAMQEFLFNMNVPTRVGFQCLSEDTEILTVEGWKKYDEIKKGMLIKTFNVKKGMTEIQKVKSVFKRKYKGVMYNLKNRIQDQLVSPKHRIVRKKFQTDKYILETVEDVLKLKSPFIIPVAGKNFEKDISLSDEQIKLMTWIIGEGSIERPGRHRCSYRVSIYQSAIKNKKNYEEIKNLLEHFNLKYSEFTHQSLGKPVQSLRLNAESSRRIHQWFTRENVKFIPKVLLNMSQRQSKLFLDTYLKAEGFEGSKITCSDIEVLNDLQAIASNAGYGSTVLVREPTIGTKTLYVLRLVKHEDTYINKIKKVKYSGIIWCPNTQNETVIARRNGKVFITGNTPFTNITFDLTLPKTFANEAAIVGGKPINKQYKDFQKEMNMINRAFAELMAEGDAQGRVFTFPIPTYNITRDFDWDNKDLDPVWEMTAKYGIPYFSNFINSDMKPEDARSMCCRLRLDNRELRKRGGGLFGSNPLTGSIGVVTLNMSRIGYLAKDEEDYFKRLIRLMDIAKDSLLTKRLVLEKLTERGLYPYSKFYLSSVKKRFGGYWRNHFNTIGIHGMNESVFNFMSENIGSPKGRRFAIKVLDFMRGRLANYQKETNELFNLEATPAEGTTYRFATLDKKLYPKIKVANENDVQENGGEPYYSNSSQLPVGYTDDIFEALELQDELQTKYTGGTVLHGFLGEAIHDGEAAKRLVKRIAENYHLPYYTLSPTFSVCQSHGYLKGEQAICPECGKTTEIFSRVVGYLRPVQQWNPGKQAEFWDRKGFKV